LASTSFEKYFNFYNRETSGKKSWKIVKKVGSTDVLSRVLITEDLNIIIQFIDNPMVIIFSVNEIFQSKEIQK
jgi:predicted methyltransferase